MILVGLDEEFLEEELVAESLALVGAEPVDLVDLPDQFHRQRKGGLDVGVGGGGSVEGALCAVGFVADTVLLVGSEVFGNSAGDDAARQALAFGFYLAEPLLGEGQLRLGTPLLFVELELEAVADGLLHFIWQPDDGVVALDCPFHVIDIEVRHLTVGAVHLLSDTEVVHIAALGVGDTEPAAATGGLLHG